MTELEQQGARLNKLRLHYKLKQNALAQRIGVHPSFLSKLINGREPITKNVIRELRENFPLLNINWLLYEDGEMFLAEKKDKNLLIVEEPEVVYMQRSDDPFGDVRSLLEQYERRIAALEERVARLEGKG